MNPLKVLRDLDKKAEINAAIIVCLDNSRLTSDHVLDTLTRNRFYCLARSNGNMYRMAVDVFV